MAAKERGQIASHGEMLESMSQLEFEEFFLFITVVSLKKGFVLRVNARCLLHLRRVERKPNDSKSNDTGDVGPAGCSVSP